MSTTDRLIEPGEASEQPVASGSTGGPASRRWRDRKAVRLAIRIADKSVIVVLTLLIVLLLELIIRVLDVPDYTLPSPWEVAQAFYSNFGSTLGPDIKTTVIEILIGLSMGLALGLVLGAWIADSRLAKKLVAPYVVAFVSTPLIVFAPLINIWLGFGLWSKVVMVILMTFGPMAVNAIQGFSALDNDKYELMRSLCASRFQIAIKARLPSAAPYLFSGMKISAVLSVIAVVVAEFVGAQSGLGYRTYQAQVVLQTDLLVAAAVCLIVIGLLLFYGVDWLSRKVVYWQE
jgi:NitT/TauT family transport system permease protein